MVGALPVTWSSAGQDAARREEAPPDPFYWRSGRFWCTFRCADRPDHTAAAIWGVGGGGLVRLQARASSASDRGITACAPPLPGAINQKRRGSCRSWAGWA